MDIHSFMFFIFIMIKHCHVMSDFVFVPTNWSAVQGLTFSLDRSAFGGGVRSESISVVSTHRLPWENVFRSASMTFGSFSFLDHFSRFIPESGPRRHRHLETRIIKFR